MPGETNKFCIPVFTGMTFSNVPRRQVISERIYVIKREYKSITIFESNIVAHATNIKNQFSGGRRNEEFTSNYSFSFNTKFTF